MAFTAFTPNNLLPSFSEFVNAHKAASTQRMAKRELDMAGQQQIFNQMMKLQEYAHTESKEAYDRQRQIALDAQNARVTEQNMVTAAQVIEDNRLKLDQRKREVTAMNRKLDKLDPNSAEYNKPAVPSGGAAAPSGGGTPAAAAVSPMTVSGAGPLTLISERNNDMGNDTDAFVPEKNPAAAQLARKARNKPVGVEDTGTLFWNQVREKPFEALMESQDAFNARANSMTVEEYRAKKRAMGFDK